MYRDARFASRVHVAVFGAHTPELQGRESQAIPGVQHVVEMNEASQGRRWFLARKAGARALEMPGTKVRSRHSTVARKGTVRRPCPQTGAVALKEGDVATALGSAAKRFEAIYDLPYLAHAR